MLGIVTDKLPDNGGYVAAAYLVFLLLLLIYVAIMAMRASRLERDLQRGRSSCVERDKADGER